MLPRVTCHNRIGTPKEFCSSFIKPPHLPSCTGRARHRARSFCSRQETISRAEGYQRNKQNSTLLPRKLEVLTVVWQPAHLGLLRPCVSLLPFSCCIWNVCFFLLLCCIVSISPKCWFITCCTHSANTALAGGLEGIHLEANTIRCTLREALREVEQETERHFFPCVL